MSEEIDYAKLLKQSNNADYAKVLKNLKEKFGREMPPHTPIQYTVSRMCGWNGIGHVVAGIDLKKVARERRMTELLKKPDYWYDD